MANQLPDPKAIPGLSAVLSSLPGDMTILGLEPELSFDWKLAIYDAKIANNIESGNLEAMGRLVEMREAIVEEKFNLTDEYVREKGRVIGAFEAQENEHNRRGEDISLRRVTFEKFRRLFQLQERFLAINYPFKAHAKERLAAWGIEG